MLLYMCVGYVLVFIDVMLDLKIKNLMLNLYMGVGRLVKMCNFAID